jgi:hypothetical protein
MMAQDSAAADQIRISIPVSVTTCVLLAGGRAGGSVCSGGRFGSLKICERVYFSRNDLVKW